MILFFIPNLQQEVLFHKTRKELPGARIIPVLLGGYNPVLSGSRNKFAFATFQILRNQMADLIKEGLFEASFKGALKHLEAEEIRIWIAAESDSLTEFQYGAIEAGINPFNFVVFEPTEFAVSQGYKPVYYNAFEAEDTWEAGEGAELFHRVEVNV